MDGRPVTFLDALWERILWMINGLLVILYFAADHLITLALMVSVGFFVASTKDEQQAWATGSSVLAVVASLFAPAPVPLFLLVMALTGWALLFLEQYNRPAQRWNVIRGQALYALAGLGFMLYRRLGLGDAVLADPMMTQGAVYLNALIGISMYVIPLGFLAWSAQSIWAHPPTPGTPDQIITKVRSRGRR
ncbi:MAG TPA: hypothetical protein VF982_05725 [Anaerolineales bacterium]